MENTQFKSHKHCVTDYDLDTGQLHDFSCGRVLCRKCMGFIEPDEIYCKNHEGLNDLFLPDDLYEI